MKRIVRLTESDLVRIVKRIVKESEDEVYDDNDDLIGHYDVGPDRLDSARFIPNQKGTEKGHSMGGNTPERSYRKPRPDSGMRRSNDRRYNDMDMNEDNYERRGNGQIVQRDKLNFEETKSGMERSINNFSLEHLIRLYNGENQINSIFKKYKPLGLLSFDDLVDYKEEDEY